MKNSGGKLSLPSKIGYGLGQLSEGVAYNFFYFFYTYFLVSVIGLSPSTAGMLSGFAVIWDAVTDPFIGYLSDFCRSRQGKRRAFIGRAAVPLGIMISLICYVPPLEGGALIVYLVVVNILFWILFTACDIPWIALGNEITDDFNEKSSLRAISTSFMLLGQLVASGFSLPLISFFCKFVSSELTAWSILGVLLGVLTAAGFAISYFATKGMDSPSKMQRNQGVGLLSQLCECIKVKGVRSLLFLSIFATTSTGIFLSGEVFYLDIFFQMDDYQISVVNIVFAIFSFLLSYYIGWLASRLDKKKVFVYHFLIAVVGFLVLWRLPKTIAAMAGTLTLFYLADVTFWTVIFSVLGDVTELQSYRAPEKDTTGFTSALLSVGIKLGTAVGMWLLGMGLELIGYSDAAVADGLQDRFGLVFYLPLALFYLLAFLCAAVYPYTRQKYQEDKNALLDKQQP